MSLLSIPSEYRKKKDNDDKLLICGCKKYAKGKNGFLFLKIEIDGDIKKIHKEFYNTRNFEVYCFFPIKKQNNKENIININNNLIIEAEYILIGGYDLDDKEGSIQLYKIIYNKDYEKIKIEFIMNIDFKKYIKEIDSLEFKGFKGAINSITQLNDNGKNLLINCLDGNIYSFTEPSIEYIKSIDNIDINQFLL